MLVVSQAENDFEKTPNKFCFLKLRKNIFYNLND